MNNKPKFYWDEASHTATCVLTDGEKKYEGIAICHPDDYDMESEKTGCEIAFKRAKISALRGYRDELKIRLKTLNQFYSTINQSKRFNENAYENKMLRRQTRLINFDLDTINEMIDSEYKSLLAYTHEKNDFYNKVRQQRKIKEYQANNN